MVATTGVEYEKQFAPAGAAEPSKDDLGDRSECSDPPPLPGRVDGITNGPVVVTTG